MKWRTPDLWDVLWCHFPGTGAGGRIPAAKARPVFVAGTDDIDADYTLVMVVYGTTQKTASIFPGEFVADPEKDMADCFQAGLLRKTKFDLSRHAELPYNSTFFACAPGRPSPLLGALSRNLQSRAIAASRRLKAL